MNSKTSSIEEFFLKVFKIVILVVMSMTLVIAAGALLFSTYQLTQRPIEPEPAKKAKAESVNIEDFINSLKKPEPKEETPPSEDKEAEEPKQSEPAKYKEEVNKIIACFRDSNKQSGITGLNTSDEVTEDFRSQLQQVADSNNFDRGQPFVDDATKIVCQIYLHSKVIEFRKSHKTQEMFYAPLKFHLKAWDELKNKAKLFDQKEQERVAKETANEEMRISLAKENAKLAFIVALGSLGLFMVIALYLIIAAIESNLRNLSFSVNELKDHHISKAKKLFE